MRQMILPWWYIKVSTSKYLWFYALHLAIKLAGVETPTGCNATHAKTLPVCEVCFVPSSSKQNKSFLAMTTPKQGFFVSGVVKGAPFFLRGVVWNSTTWSVPVRTVFGKRQVWLHFLVAKVFIECFLIMMKSAPFFKALVMSLGRPVL